MAVLIAGGTGFIGRALVNHFLEKNETVTIVSRSKPKAQRIFDKDVEAMSWDELSQQPQEILESKDWVINLAGSNLGRWPWTEAYKKKILYSRLWTTKTIAEGCAQLKRNAPALFNASAVGTYGLQKPQKQGLPEPMDESTSLDFDHPSDFLAKVGRAWEKATAPAKEAGVRVVNMRFGIVLGPQGGVLSKLKLPFYFFMGGTIGSGQQPFSWIALPDLLRAIDFLYEHPKIEGPVNLVSENCVTQKQLAKTLGKVMRRPAWMYTPGWVLKWVLGEMAELTLLNGQHVVPKVLKAQGFTFQYPTIDEALAYAIQSRSP